MPWVVSYAEVGHADKTAKMNMSIVEWALCIFKIVFKWVYESKILSVIMFFPLSLKTCRIQNMNSWSYPRLLKIPTNSIRHMCTKSLTHLSHYYLLCKKLIHFSIPSVKYIPFYWDCYDLHHNLFQENILIYLNIIITRNWS